MESVMTKEELQQVIRVREADISHYQVNIDNYTAMIAMLPESWPAHLEQYRSAAPVELSDVLPFEDVQTVSDLQFKEQLKKMLLTERLEQRKSMLVLAALRGRNDS